MKFPEIAKIDRFAMTITALKKIRADLPTYLSLDGTVYKTDAIFEQIDTISHYLTRVKQIEINDLLLSEQIDNLRGYFNNFHSDSQSILKSPEQFGAYGKAIMTSLAGIRRCVIPLLQTTDILPSEVLASYTPLNNKVQEIEALIQSAKNAAESSKINFDLLEDVASRITNAHAEATSILAKIQAVKTDSDAELAKIVANKTVAEQSNQRISEASTKIEKWEKELEAAEHSKETLFKEFEGHKKNITELLENAGKVGLALAFKKKADESALGLRRYENFVRGSLVLLFLMQLGFFVSLISKESDLIQFATRQTLALPVIWFAWFSIRQYGHTLRIHEDYSFKSAAALSFVGYRNEMSNDPSMIKLLQENAIKTFGSNPSRIFDKKHEPASPVHELLEKVLEKVEVKDLIELLKVTQTKTKDKDKDKD